MDLEKNKQRLEILAAEVEELKNNGGGGGGTVDAYTKAEADNKFAEKTNVYTKTEADNKFAEKATTYTKTEVDEAIAAAGGGLPAYVNMPTGSNAYFPEDKMEILEKHLPFTTSNPPTSTSDVYLFIGNYGGSYIYKKFANDGFTGILEINQSTRKITSTTKSGGGVISDVNSANYMSRILDRPQDTVSSQSDFQKQILFLDQNADLNNQNYTTYSKMVICSSDATAATLTNCPTDKAFYMFNDRYASHPTQTIFENNNPNIFYRRTLASSKWTAWYKFEGTVVS